MKDVIDISEMKVDQSTQKPVLTGLAKRIGDVDRRAVEAALQLREKHGGKVTLLSLGDEKTPTALKEALAMGADDAYVLRDASFEGSDTLATSRILAAGIRKIGGFDAIFCGETTLDSLSAQVGPRVAQILGLPQLEYVKKIELVDGKLRAQRDLGEDEMVEVSPPAVVIVTREVNEPRIPSLMNIIKASRKTIIEWDSSALGLGRDLVGVQGSGVMLLDVRVPPMERKKIIIKAETPEEAVEMLIDRLQKDGVLRR